METVFYSWQSDLPRRENRDLIKAALDDAVKELSADAGIEDAVRVDQDTQDVPGNPVVVDAILEKIRTCRVFAPDLSFVAKTESDEKVSNPNVLIELGFALESVGDRKTLAIMNEFYGPATELPFDLGHRRWPIKYTLAPDASKEELASTRKKLKAAFVAALKVILSEPRTGPLEAHENWTAQPVDGWGSFLADGDSAFKWDVPGADEEQIEFFWRNGAQAFFHIIPSQSANFRRARVLEAAHTSFRPFSEGGDVKVAANTHGACVADANSKTKEVYGLTQLFCTGEVWGLHRLRESPRVIPMTTVRRLFRDHIQFALSGLEAIDVALPLTITYGIEGILDWRIGSPGGASKNRCMENRIVLEETVTDYKLPDRDRTAAAVLEAIYDAAGIDPHG